MTTAKKLIAVVSLMFAAALTSTVEAQSSFASVYQRDGFGTQGAVQLSLESAFGTREARPFGEKGFEQGVRSRFSITDAIALEAWGGFLLDTADTTVQAGAFSAEAQFGVLRQERQGVNLSLVAGFKRDFQAVSVPLARVCASKTFGALNVGVSGLVEVPLADNRDPADLIVEAVASYEVAQGLDLGVEAAGEDLEAFWEPEEAEGGARLIVGPSLRLTRAKQVDVRLHAGAVVVATTEGGAAGAPVQEPGAGFLGRLSAGYTF